ncbi:MAG: phenylalanine--tRNA ligase subunit beta [Planctomycetota bacterium]
MPCILCASVANFMKFTYNWLKEYCPCGLPITELAELLTKHGVKVESLEPTLDGKDTLITLEITANRSDCLSLLGVARETALITGQKLPHKQAPELEIPKASAEKFIKINNLDLCPVYVGRIIKHVKVGPSPDWLRNRIESIGLRSVNNIVDITNFVLMETGQPLHAFDYNALENKEIIVRLAAPGEKIMAIDGKEYQLAKDTLVIADAKKPVAIAGIMGGKQTEVTERTTDILLESAYFQPGGIRKSSRWLKLTSDSAYRFERGVIPEEIITASDRAIELILASASGKVAAHQSINNLEIKTRKLTLRHEYLEKVLGVGIDKTDLKRILKGLGFIIKKEWKGQYELEAPYFRQDINIEEDIIEEVVRIIGYDNIPAEPPTIQLKNKPKDKDAEVTQAARQILFGLGYNEALTDSFLATKEEAGANLLKGSEEAIGLLDTENNVRYYLRTSLVNGLYKVLTLNENYQKDNALKLFEISKIYYKETNQPKEQLRLGIVENNGFGSLKGTLTVLFNKLGLSWKTDATNIIISGEIIGSFSPIGPELDNNTKTYICEFNFEEIINQTKLITSYQEFSRMPAISRDLAVVVSGNILWSNIEQVVRQAITPTQSELPLESLDFFDLYRGKQIPDGKKSIAFSMTFRHPSKTLSAQKAEEVMNLVASALQTKLSAQIRQK